MSKAIFYLLKRDYRPKAQTLDDKPFDPEAARKLPKLSNPKQGLGFRANS